MIHFDISKIIFLMKPKKEGFTAQDFYRENNLKINTYLNCNDQFLKSKKGTCDKSKCIYSYATGYNGKYKFETKIRFNDNMENIKTTPNTF